MENSRLSKSQSISRHASNHEIKSSLKDIQTEYSRALEQIENLKTERSYLKAALNKSVEERTNKSAFREESISVDQVPQILKNSSYANKALVESEKRVLDLEEENKELRKLVKSYKKKFVKMQEEILSYQYEVDKLGYLKVYNQDLQAEMELLDQEFQTIIKRIDVIDEEKSQSQANLSMSIKNNKEFKQILLKYSNYISKSISSLEPKHYLRFRFEEIFSSESEILNLIVNKEYSTLILKTIKLIADILPSNGDNIDQDASLNRLSPFSVGEITPQKGVTTVFSPVSDPIWTQMADVSPQTSQLLPTSLTRGLQNSQVRDLASSQIRLQKAASSQSGQAVNESVRKPRETQSSLSFGTRESKPQSIDMKAEETPRSLRIQHESIQKLDVSPIERPTHNFPELKNNTVGNSSSMYIRDDDYGRTAAELELIQREKELILRERELMEKKKEYLQKSKEMTERDQSMASEHRSIREKDNKSLNESSSEHGRIKSQRRMTSEAEESNARIREDELESRRSPTQLKSILKSGGSQVIENLEKEKESVMKRRKDDETLSIGSGSNHIRSAKDMSNVLREKSRHIQKVLTKGSLYEEDLQSLKSEQESSMHRESPIQHQFREKSPNPFEEEAHESLKPSKIKSLDRSLREDVDSRFGSNDTSLLGDKKSFFYPKSVNNQSMNNQSRSYHPPSMAAQRLDSHESRKDESSNKKVSFFAQYQKTTGSDPIESVSHSQQHSRQSTELQEEDNRRHMMAYQTARRYNEVPRGTQYASFSVAFGRTESAERDPSSPVKNFGSIIDVLMKKRIDHTYQTYDVIKGEENWKRAVRESGSPQYKVVAEPPNSSRRAKRCFFGNEDYMNIQSKPAS